MSDKYAQSRSNYLAEKGWTWFFKPKPKPRKLYRDERFALMRPSIKVER